MFFMPWLSQRKNKVLLNKPVKNDYKNKFFWLFLTLRKNVNTKTVLSNCIFLLNLVAYTFTTKKGIVKYSIVLKKIKI